MPGPEQFGYPDASAAATDGALVADSGADPHCGLPGWVSLTVDDDGTARQVCAADYPVWGVASADATTVKAGPDGTFFDSRTALLWRAAPLPGLHTHAAALKACDALTAAGYSDWRLPTVAEVWSTMDFTRSDGAVALPLAVTPGAIAWTAIVHADAAWSVALADGSSALLPAGAEASAWCVRAERWAKPLPSQRFSGAVWTGFLTDTATGLQWERTPMRQSEVSDAPIQLPPMLASGECRNRGLHGHGWRLPSVAELMSLIDRSGPAPAMAPEVFTQGDGIFQTLSPAATPPGGLWAVDFRVGQLLQVPLSDAPLRIRCVRDPCGDSVCGTDETPDTCPADCMARVLIPSGTFWQGCDPASDPGCDPVDAPAHLVKQSAFVIDKREVTVAQYEACVMNNICDEQPHDLPLAMYPYFRAAPINYVTWEQANKYCEQWLRSNSFLARETHFEIAARGDCAMNGSAPNDPECREKMRVYPWGNDAPDCKRASFTAGKAPIDVTACGANPGCGCGHHRPCDDATHDSGTSPYGVEDLAGNLAEWTLDSVIPYPDGPVQDPGFISGAPWVLRGGGFLSSPKELRSSHRTAHDGNGAVDIGFRCSGFP
jgi:sulfatase modifying factor 1